MGYTAAHHRAAAFGCFWATPVLGLLLGMLFWGPLAYLGVVAPGGGFVTALLFMMMFSWTISWAVMLVLGPLVVRLAARFGAQLWVAVPFGALAGTVVGMLVFSVFIEPAGFGVFGAAGALVGAVMAGFYCGFLRHALHMSQRHAAG